MILFKKMYRTLFKYKAQFISMIVMIFLGVSLFLGFNGEWYSLKLNGENHINSNNMADYWIYSDTSFSSDNLDTVNSITGIDNASRRLNVNTTINIEGQSKTISLNVVDNYKISTNTIIEGEEYNSSSLGIFLNDKFASENNLKLGDTISLTYNSFNIEGKIVSLIKNPEYLYAVEDENQVMPDFSTYGYAYITPTLLKNSLGFEIYNQIIVDSSLGKSEFTNKINDAFDSTMLILTRDESPAIQMLNGEIEEGNIMGNILPVIFLGISILVMITTMHRITTNEKSQIGILKALGFRNKKILLHYVSFGLIVGLIGTIIAIPLGLLVTCLIVNPYFFEGTCFDFPTWNIAVPWWCYLVLVFIVLVICLIALLSTRQTLKGPASDTLKPSAPKRIHNLLIERTKLWKKLSFSTKWNLRDVIRSKARTIMGLIGVIGCALLLSASLGMRDTMSVFMDNLNTQTLNFKYKVILNENVNKDDISTLIKDIEADTVASTSIKIGDDTYGLEIYDNSHDYIRVLDEGGAIVKLADDGVYICKRIADKLNIDNNTLVFNLFGSDFDYNANINGTVKSNTGETIYMSNAYAKKLLNSDNVSLDELVGISYLLTDNDVFNNPIISKIQLKDDVVNSYNSMMEIMDLMVIILIVFALLLGFVVLYNLGAISYVEKYRELATLKVVGFKNKKIGSLLIKQNIWLTIIGSIIGLPIGYVVLDYLLEALASEYEMNPTLTPLSVFITLALTILTSVVVNILISQKNKKINMVESLKIAD